MVDFFETSQVVNAGVERTFRFFADPANLPRISPPASAARLIRLKLVSPGGENGLAGVGSEIEISVRLAPPLPFRGRWLARITEFEVGKYFRDVQVRGPFKLWDHRHSFQASAAGTVIRDTVQYEVGWGKLGDGANAIFVRRALEKMFAHRHAAAERLLSQSA